MYVTKAMQNSLRLPNAYIIQHSVCPSTQLQSLEIVEDMRMCSFSIENVYTNMPKSWVTNIAGNNPKIEKAVE
jgi:hypothetical protein